MTVWLRDRVSSVVYVPFKCGMEAEKWFDQKLKQKNILSDLSTDLCFLCGMKIEAVL